MIGNRAETHKEYERLHSKIVSPEETVEKEQMKTAVYRTHLYLLYPEKFK